MPSRAAREFAEIILGMNVKKFAAATKKAVSASKRMADKMKQHQASLRSLSLKAGIALGAQVLFIKKVTGAASKQELVEKKLADAVLRHEGATMANVEALKAQAAALQQVTKFGDEATIEAQALLATYGVLPKDLERATQATLDFAAATGRDLKTAALTVGKSVGAGFTAELSRYGIILDVSTIPKTKVATAVLDKLNEQFGGRAQQEAETYSGRLIRMTNAFGDLQEQVGFAFFPVLEKLFDTIRPLIEQAGAWVEAHQKLVAGIGIAGVGGTGLLLGLTMMGLMLPAIVTAIAAILSPIGLAIAAVGALAIATLALTGRLPETSSRVNEFREYQKDLNEQIAAGAEKLKDNEAKSKSLKEEIRKLTEKIAEGGTENETYVATLETTKEKLEEVEAETKKLTTENKNLIDSQQDLLKLDLANRLTENRKEYKQLTEQEKASEKQTYISARAMEARARSIGITTNLLKKNRAEHTELIAEMERLIGFQDESTQATDEATAATYRATAAQEKALQVLMQVQAWIDKPNVWEKMIEDMNLFEEEIGEVPELVGMALTDAENAMLNFVEGVLDLTTSFHLAWADAYDQVLKEEKNFAKAFGKGAVLAFIRIIRAAIEIGIAELLVLQAKEVYKALIEAPGTLGASLIKIPLIAAAGAAAIAGMRALEKKYVGSFLEGGLVRETGTAVVHEGEIVFNPKRNTLADFLESLSQISPTSVLARSVSAPAMSLSAAGVPAISPAARTGAATALAASGGPWVIQHNHFQGGIHYDADVKKVANAVAHRIAMIRAGV